VASFLDIFQDGPQDNALSSERAGWAAGQSPLAGTICLYNCLKSPARCSASECVCVRCASMRDVAWFDESGQRAYLVVQRRCYIKKTSSATRSSSFHFSCTSTRAADRARAVGRGACSVGGAHTKDHAE
jgi:hypothetical protein